MVAGFWGGWWDVHQEGQFENINTREPLQDDAYQPWYFGEPNGNTIENCQTVWPYRDAWNDLSCTDKTVFFCEFEQAPYLQMRGMSIFTKGYVLRLSIFARKTPIKWPLVEQKIIGNNNA